MTWLSIFPVKCLQIVLSECQTEVKFKIFPTESNFYMSFYGKIFASNALCPLVKMYALGVSE